jgi:hypothetical protein
MSAALVMPTWQFLLVLGVAIFAVVALGYSIHCSIYWQNRNDELSVERATLVARVQQLKTTVDRQHAMLLDRAHLFTHRRLKP